MSTIIKILRMPRAPNALYHLACYTPKRDELVLIVQRLRKAERCASCKKTIRQGQQSQEESKNTAKIVQLAMF